ncbi:UDP-N-acetylmuramoyl-L-alanyl-D-glutamate--2,6-diaminopimelate ligase [Acetobacter sp. AN02]|uniref:UDP-N-acetylmuramoyl-L-alanyl-D-glutamate--2, 6-diaminopimelate ligase n=1 Tax=Acetobacter sp. AN02 TaxID=2894186 RepID=UPI00243428EC|nr:UDP-N-acetylmuramoyl-L-alanyl-D-glutamate--2,6-diaminopimelate ligase [Acetobacter sp. AN02]MDG6094210.1 UDP-N-acetylmuramoyl-L-alanyl-D-glutamate--2,6-diaminopimelate ligase [Acetobacter sp. AN02]
MRLSDLLAKTPQQLTMSHGSDPEITGLTGDSRTCAPGMLFAAIPGTQSDGRDYIPRACAAGAAAILTTPDATVPEGVATIRSDAPRHALALLAAAFAGPQPGRIVAITGTNGKTSTADFLRQIMMLQGHKAVSLGTLGLKPDMPLPVSFPSLTTPDPVTLASGLAALKTAGVTDVAMEASSHGLDQQRLDGVTLSAAGFTNLTRDHLDYHGSLEDYRKAKLRLLDTLLPEGGLVAAWADMDPETLGAIRRITTARRQTLRLVGEAGTTLRLLKQTPQPDGQILSLGIGGRTTEVALKLPGRFQADNVLLAVALAATDESRLEDILALLPRLEGVRGRMERVLRLPDGAAAYVDYAHTPDALERVLKSLRPHATGRLIVLFGAGGNRDRGKRPLMARAAADYADLVIVTDDNPRNEDARTIRQDVLAGAPDAIEIGDRRKAIAEALSMLRSGDVLLLAGKGHEQGQIIGSEIHPFDDAQVLRELAA